MSVRLDRAALLRSLYSVEAICFDGDDPPGGGDAAAAAQAAAAQAAADQAAATAAAAAGKGGGSDKRFSQADIDVMIQDRVKNMKKELTAAEANYQNLLQQQNLSADQRIKLEADLEAVQSQLRSKDQQLEHERKKAAEKHDTEIKKVVTERDHYKNLFETSTIDRAITDAAMVHDGFNAEIFIALLGPKTKMVNEIDKLGQSTGRLVPMVDWAVKDDKGTTMVTKTPAEVVELMKDDTDRYGGMFKSHVARGVGGGTAAGAGTAGTTGAVNHKKMTDAEYFKLREDAEARARMGLPPLQR